MSARDIATMLLDEVAPAVGPDRLHPWPHRGGPLAFSAEVSAPDGTAERWVVVQVGDSAYAVQGGTGRVFGRGKGIAEVTCWKVAVLPHVHRGPLAAVSRSAMERGHSAESLGCGVPVVVDSPALTAKRKAEAKAAKAKPVQEVPVSKPATAQAPFSRPTPPPPPTLTATSREAGRVTVVETEHSVELTHARLVALVAFACGRQIPEGAVVRVVWADRPEEPAMGAGDGVKVAWTTTAEAKA